MDEISDALPGEGERGPPATVSHHEHKCHQASAHRLRHEAPHAATEPGCTNRNAGPCNTPQNLSFRQLGEAHVAVEYRPGNHGQAGERETEAESG